jgi:hypothetical protein
MSKGLLKQTLDDLAPQEDIPAWEDVLDRAGIETPRPARRPLWKRSWSIVLAALVAVLVPLAAIGSEQDWWFFRFGPPLKPVSEVVVVKTGSWSGNDWELIAFRSDTKGLCFGLQPTRLGTSRNGAGGVIGCSSFAGVPRTSDVKPSSLMINVLIAIGIEKNEQAVPYAAGPVSDEAAQVDIYLQGGEVVHTPAFDAPEELGAPIRFYATQLPSSALPSNPEGGGGALPITKLVGLDGEGKVVACLLVPSGKHDLSDCE